MKKLFFAASLFATLAFNVNAQDETASDFKAQSGDVTGEFSVNGGILNTSFGLNSGLLRFRYFFADDMAARVGLGIAREREKDLISNGAGEYGTITGSYSQFAINLGVEKHFSGTDRLSPYVGADLLFSRTNVRESGEDVDAAGAYASGDSYEVTGALNQSTLTLPTDFSAGTGIGLRLVGGADFYILRHVFLGAEFGWGFMATNERNVESSITTDGTTTSSETEQGSTFSISPSVIGNLRIGFVF